MDYLDIRAEWSASDAERDKGLTTPPDVARTDNISYGPHGRWNTLDIYRPKGTEETPLPVIVSVHGGGWVYGDKELYQYYCMDLARRGFAVVNFNYRLAPEDPFPAAVEDVNAAFTWVAEQGPKYHLDTDHLFVVGDSAGGQLGAQYCAMLTDPAFGAMYDFALPKLTVRAAAFHCGHYQFDGSEGSLSQATMRAYFGENAREKLPLVDTLAHITPAFPPTLVMTAWYDFLKDQAPLLCQALKAQGVPYEYRLYGREGQEHMAHVFHIAIRTPEAIACNDEQCAFFRAHM